MPGWDGVSDFYEDDEDPETIFAIICHARRMATDDDIADLKRAVQRLQVDQLELRTRVATGQTTIAAVHQLAAGTDRDVSGLAETLRAHVSTLNALRETQLEQAAQLAAFRQETAERFSSIEGGLAAIAGMLQQLIDRE